MACLDVEGNSKANKLRQFNKVKSALMYVWNGSPKDRDEEHDLERSGDGPKRRKFVPELRNLLETERWTAQLCCGPIRDPRN